MATGLTEPDTEKDGVREPVKEEVCVPVLRAPKCLAVCLVCAGHITRNAPFSDLQGRGLHKGGT